MGILRLCGTDLTKYYSLQLTKEIEERFSDRDGVDILMETMKCKQQHTELSCLALQYFLHIAEYHPDFIAEAKLQFFNAKVLPILLRNDLTKELLVETFHA